MSHSVSDVAAYAAQFFDGPAYEWGSSDVGPVAEFRRAVEAGGTVEESIGRVMEWAAADFRARCYPVDAGSASSPDT